MAAIDHRNNNQARNRARERERRKKERFNVFNLCENQLIFTKIVNRNGLECTAWKRDANSMNCFIKRKTYTNRLYCIVCHMCNCGAQIFAADIIFTNFLAPQLNAFHFIVHCPVSSTVIIALFMCYYI